MNTYGPDSNSARIRRWLAQVGADGRRRLRAWLDGIGITNLKLAKEHAGLRRRVVKAFAMA